MKNKNLAIFGIASYILSIITSAENLEGNYTSPDVLIAISGIATIVFTIMAIIRLWKESKHVSTLFVFTNIITIVLGIIREITPQQYGSPIILLNNVFEIINFITFIYVVCLLWTKAKCENKVIS